MRDVKLVYPSPEYVESYLGFCREHKDARLTTFHLRDDPDDYDAWKHSVCQKYADYRQGKRLPEGFVPCTLLWLVEDGEVIGLCDIRHELNEFLARYGGHIGYMIRPSRWRQGYGTLQLRLALDEARKIGLTRLLITCNDDNEGSARVIEANGGAFEGAVTTPEGILRRRYWIEL